MQKTTSKSTYISIASMYDKIMSHVEYDLWLDLINAVIEKYSTVTNPKILELGGGTGVLGKMLKAYGHDYVGSDLSFSMCQESFNKKLPFFCADCRYIPIKKSFDLMIFLYDGINYLLNPNDYYLFFKEAYKNLNKDGLLLFDITTKTNSQQYFSNVFDFEDYDTSYYIRRSYFDNTKDIQYNDFTFFIKHTQENCFSRYDEHHKQKIYSVKKILNFIPDNLFTVIGQWDNYSFKKATSKSTRIHFLLKRL